MKNKKKNLIILIFLGLLNVIAIISYYILFMDISNKNDHISEITQNINNNYQINNTRTSLENLVANTSEDRQKISTYFIDKNGTAKFLEMVESLAKEKSLEFNVKSVGIDDAIKNNASTTIAFLALQLETKGSWNNIMNFYSLLETLPYKTKFITMQITKDIITPNWDGIVNFSTAILK